MSLRPFARLPHALCRANLPQALLLDVVRMLARLCGYLLNFRFQISDYE